ncbi:MAG: ComEC/Rec2 family competence protein, partial [Pseudomonadota bacterium]
FEKLRRALTAAWQREHTQRLLWAPAGLAAGAGLYFNLPFEPPIAAGIFALWVSVLLAWLLPTYRTIALLIGLICASFCGAQVKTHAFGPSVITKQQPARTYIARVERVEERLEGGWRIHLSDLASPGETLKLPAKVRLVARTDVPATLRAGQRISLRAVLTPLPRPVLPGSYDFGRALFLKGYGATGFAVSAVTVLTGPDEALEVSVITRARKSVDAAINKALAGPSAGLAKALLLGDKSQIPRDVRETYRRAGLAHLLAISGLHMALVAGCVFLCIRQGLSCSARLALILPLKSIAAGVTIAALICYLMLVGAPVSAQRATLMASCVMLAIIVGRSAISLRTAALAAIPMLVLWPENITDIGFQMSFAAVVALVSGYEAAATTFARLRVRYGPVRGGALNYLLGIMLSTILAEIAVLPLSLYHFNEITVYGLIGNAFAVPITGFWVMPAGLVGILLTPFGLADPAFYMMGLGLDLMTALTQDISAAPGAYLAFKSPSTVALLVFCCAGLWLCLWRTRLRYLSVPVLLIIPFVAFSYQMPTLLLSPSANAFAVKTTRDGYVLLHGKRSSFAAQVWAREMGQAGFSDMKERYQRCDMEGCVIQLELNTDGGLAAVPQADLNRPPHAATSAALYRLEYVKHPAGLSDACSSKSFIIVAYDAHHRCEGTIGYISADTLARDGPASIFLSASVSTAKASLYILDMKISYARASRRPWVP